MRPAGQITTRNMAAITATMINSGVPILSHMNGLAVGKFR
jgi:hypothetical protein